MSEKRVCDSCIHKSYPTGQRYEYFENKDIYIRDNLTGERFYMSDLDMLCNLLNNYDKDWQRRRVERALEIQKECFKISARISGINQFQNCKQSQQTFCQFLHDGF